MTIGEAIGELLGQGCSLHCGPCPDFMGLNCPNEGFALVIDTADGRRFSRHIPPGVLSEDTLMRALNLFIDSRRAEEST
jgi:hypothetical protein